MDDKKRKYPDDYPYVENDEMFTGAVSATEATGLTATVPEDEAEAESYRDIYNLPLQPDAPPSRH